MDIPIFETWLRFWMKDFEISLIKRLLLRTIIEYDNTLLIAQLDKTA